MEEHKNELPPPPLPIDCMNLANTMSCATMTRMAKREVAHNFSSYVFSASSPACYMNLNLADREKEMQLLAGNGLSKSMCFNPAAFDKTGNWESQFPTIGVTPQCFDAKTRPR